MSKIERNRIELIWPGKQAQETAPGSRATAVPPLKIRERFPGRYSGAVSAGEVGAASPDSAESRKPGGLADTRPAGWRNQLIRGESLSVVQSLLGDLAGEVNLIYIDPPYLTGTAYAYPIRIGGPDSGQEQRVIRRPAYCDSHDGGAESYLQWFYELCRALKALLHPQGSLYVHLDWHLAHYARLILDEVFGVRNFRAEIAWKRTTKTTNSRQYGREHDTILVYSRSRQFTYHQQFKPLAAETLLEKYRYLQTPGGQVVNLTRNQRMGLEAIPPGRRFRCVPLLNLNSERPNLRYSFRGFTRVWAVSRERMMQLEALGLIYQARPDCLPMKKAFLDEARGAKVNSLWEDIPPVNSQSAEKTGYSTQKPEALLERILRTSSSEGDLVLDVFCGSGTTLAVAEKLGRRWIGCDAGREAVQITRKRLFDIAGCRPFDILDQECSPSRVPASFDLEIVVAREGDTIVLSLDRVKPPGGEQVPAEIQAQIRHWSDYVEAWSVDWDYDGEVFEHRWSSHRTYRKREIALSAGPHRYPGPGRYRIRIQVTCIWGEEALRELVIQIDGDGGYTLAECADAACPAVS